MPFGELQTQNGITDDGYDSPRTAFTIVMISSCVRQIESKLIIVHYLQFLTDIEIIMKAVSYL